MPTLRRPSKAFLSIAMPPWMQQELELFCMQFGIRGGGKSKFIRGVIMDAIGRPDLVEKYESMRIDLRKRRARTARRKALERRIRRIARGKLK